MKNIALNIDKTAGFIAEGAVKAYAPKVQEALEMLEKGTGLTFPQASPKSTSTIFRRLPTPCASFAT